MDKKEYNAEWAKRNPNKVREMQRRFRDKNPGYAGRRTAAWRRRNQVAVLYDRARKSGIAYKLGCDITAEDVAAMLKPMRCSVTGLELSLDWEGPGRRNPWAPSLDRIDSSKGYVRGNVRMVCVIFNIAKGDWTDEIVKRFRKEPLKT